MDAQPAMHYEQLNETRYLNPSVKQQAFAFMGHLVGWCTEDKASILIDLILRTKPEVVVEIGVWGGKSLVPMAHALKTNGKGIIYGIDPWDSNASVAGMTEPANIAHWSWVDHEQTMNDLILKITQFGLQQHVTLIRSTSEDAQPIMNIDILHIDGNHSDIFSYADVLRWVPRVKQGGWIILDDMTWYENGVNTTGRAVAWLDAHCKRLATFNDSSVWGIWVKS